MLQNPFLLSFRISTRLDQTLLILATIGLTKTK